MLIVYQSILSSLDSVRVYENQQDPGRNVLSSWWAFWIGSSTGITIGQYSCCPCIEVVRHCVSSNRSTGISCILYPVLGNVVDRSKSSNYIVGCTHDTVVVDNYTTLLAGIDSAGI